MATLLLTAVGTMVGGPLGGAIGALAGRQVDGMLVGNQSREGPRLKQLSVTTSSYGQPIPRHFGRMRSAGTIIWATDLVERSESSGGGKGKPKTTSYSYSVSFAVALSSQPIQSVGKIWADGNLLRGTDGKLKTAGSLRIYTGHRNQQPDPLIEADEGFDTPAFRELAYVVFEDLELGDFGNRIPSLSFELVGPEQGDISLAQIVPGSSSTGNASELTGLGGFADEGGELGGTLALFEELFGLSCTADGAGLSLSRVEVDPDKTPLLPEEVYPHDQSRDKGVEGREHARAHHERRQPFALRYYDESRDYQLGIQRSFGQAANGKERVIEFPGAFAPAAARALCLAMARKARWQRERIVWRVAELDPQFSPGSVVRVPDHSGFWLIESWEWLDRGVQLALRRVAQASALAISTDAGSPYLPIDLPLAHSRLLAFELPLENAESGASGSYFAALSSDGAGWPGAALYLDQSGTLAPLAAERRVRSVIGTLAEPLAPSASVILERKADLVLDLPASDLSFASTTIGGLASGANRLLVGQEILQFTLAQQLSATRWRLTGLLRGRGGTEHIAAIGHSAGADAVLLDDTLVRLDPAAIDGSNVSIVAIGLGDAQPAQHTLAPSGVSRNPPAPVHARHTILANGNWRTSWIRRARGQWRWLSQVDVPLVEERELNEVGLGSVTAPFAIWASDMPELEIDAASLATLAAEHGPAPLWVRQVGTLGKSPATLIAQFA